jgi:outer membrane lipase/esterase
MRHIKHLFIRSGLIIGFILIAHPAWSQVSRGDNQNDRDFLNYLRTLCQTNSDFTSVPRNFVLCDTTFQGSFGVPLDGRNSVGVQPTGDGKAPGGVKGRAGSIQVGGSGLGTVSSGAEDGGFGLLITGLESETERTATELENGFESELDGIVLGVDYQFSDAFILGLALGSIDDEAVIAGGGGFLETESSSQTIYATWVPIENLSVDFYYGNIDSDFESGRNFSFSSPSIDIEGFITGSYEGTQKINGASINYDWNLGSWSLGAFFGIDSAETNTDGYSETGRRTNEPGPSEPAPPASPDVGDPTGFEFRYPDQKIESATQSLGLRLGYSAGFGWGVLLPNLKLISVSEDKNDARIVPLTFASAPDTISPFVVQTDDPDRDYMTGSFGVVAAFNNGIQVFLDFEDRSGHEFLETSSTTLGALFAF